MKTLSVTLVLVAAYVLVSQTASAESGLENCYAVTATADARNREISTERALRRLHHHIAHELRSPAGKTVGPTSTHCIRNACEASAIVCRH